MWNFIGNPSGSDDGLDLFSGKYQRSKIIFRREKEPEGCVCVLLGKKGGEKAPRLDLLV